MKSNALNRPTIALAALLLCAVPVIAQQPAPPAAAQNPDGGVPSYIKPETPEQRKARLGTVEDPGPNPSETTEWSRYGKLFRIEKFDRRWAGYQDQPQGWVRPMQMVNFAAEIYQQNERWVWVWVPVIEPQAEGAPAPPQPESPRNQSRFDETHVAFFKKVRPQFTELIPPASSTRVVFAESSTGLPTVGSWRNSMAVADMNGDGFLDIVAPPERGARSALPSIFLGDGKGGWKPWSGVTWPHNLDYGGVAVADFNKDGHQDVAFAVHLDGVYAFLGDSRGQFRSASEGLPHDFPTRRIAAADVDGDGDFDLVASSEGPTMVQNAGEGGRGSIRVFLNDGRAGQWRSIDAVAPDVKIGGDWLTLANLNGDKYPDIIASSVFFGGVETVHLSTGPRAWKTVASDGDLIPSLSYYFASAALRPARSKTDDAIISYVRYWPSDLEPERVPKPSVEALTSIDRLTMVKGRVVRQPIMRWSGPEGVWGLATGDLDGNGHADILATRHNPRGAVLLLADGKGGFERGTIEGLAIDPNENYDLRIVDVNGDKRPDVLVMYESAGVTALSPRDGSIRVFLNRGAAAVPATAAK